MAKRFHAGAIQKCPIIAPSNRIDRGKRVSNYFAKQKGFNAKP
jgi:hypothetical protein